MSEKEEYDYDKGYNTGYETAVDDLTYIVIEAIEKFKSLMNIGETK